MLYFFDESEFDEVRNDGTGKVSGISHSILHSGQRGAILLVSKE